MPKKTPKGKGKAAAATLKSTRKSSDRSPPFSTAATRRGARGMPQTDSAAHEAADETAANEVAGVRARAQEHKEGTQELGKACSSFQKCHFSHFFSLKFLLECAIFRHFSPTTKRHFSPHFAPRKKVQFSRKKSRKTGSTQLTAQNWTIFRRISHREKYNFSPFFASRKSAIFRRISLREKKEPFSRKKSRKTGSTQHKNTRTQEYSEERISSAPHTSGPRDVPRVGL
jgi:hypothetical protein